MEPFELVRPDRLEAALAALADPEAVAMAGGTSLVLMLKQNLLTPRRVVWLGRVAGLDGVETRPDGRLRLGANVSLDALSRLPVVRERYPLLAEAAAQVGNPRVRAAATLGGALVHADPAQDLPPALIALGAEAVVAGPSGERRVAVRPGEFFRDYLATAVEPGEVVVGVELPPPPAGERAVYLRYAPRSQDDFPTVAVACRVAIDAAGTVREAAVAVSGVAPTPLAVEAAAALCGTGGEARLVAEVAAAAAAAADPWEDARGSPRYKRAMTRLWTERALRAVGLGSA